jgi:hypothetical protein
MRSDLGLGFKSLGLRVRHPEIEECSFLSAVMDGRPTLGLHRPRAHTFGVCISELSDPIDSMTLSAPGVLLKLRPCLS